MDNQLHGVAIKDLYMYRFISGLTLSPSGDKALFVLYRADEESNDYKGDLYLLVGQQSKQLTAERKIGNYLFLDENRILFSSEPLDQKEDGQDRLPETHFYELDLRGGEALPSFCLPLSASSIKKIDDDRFIVGAIIDSNYPDLYQKSEEERKKIAAELKEQADYEVLDESPFYVNGMGFVNKKRAETFLYTRSNHELKLISLLPQQGEKGLYLDGKIYYLASEVKRTPVVLSSIVSYDLSSQKSEVLLEAKYAISGLYALGGRLLVIATDFQEYGINENPKFYFYDEKTRDLALLCDPDDGFPDEACSDIHYGGATFGKSEGGFFYYSTAVGDGVVLKKLSPSGAVEAYKAAPGSIFDFDVVGDRVLVVGDYGLKLSEVYSLGREGLTQLTHLNEEGLKNRYVAKPEPLTIQSAGYEIHGWVLKPFGYDPDKKYPGILDIHGGPKAIYSPIFMQEQQLWAGKGYFVFFCNPFGSSGRGNAFADLRDKYGTIDYRNIMDFTDEVLKRYPAIDKSKINVTGGSYGGYMTNWIITHTGRFLSAATQRSISNWVSMLGVSDIGVNDIVTHYKMGDNQNYFTPDGIKILWDMSPLQNVGKAKTPTLFIHSDEDHRCPISEGYQLFTGLLYQNVESRMVVFHGENHELSRSGKPKHRERRLDEITSWFEKHNKR